jgi:hypothetical protein
MGWRFLAARNLNMGLRFLVVGIVALKIRVMMRRLLFLMVMRKGEF